MAELTAVPVARGMVLERTGSLGAAEVPLAQARGRVLAEDVIAPEDVPGFDNSAMDGYAVRAEDIAPASPESPVALTLAGESAAGHPAERGPGPGEAVAISTGAMIPEGADAVVRVEDTRRIGAAGTGDPAGAQAVDAAAGAAGRVDRGAGAADGEPVGIIEVVSAAPPGCDIRRAGEDVRAGQRVLAAGTPVGPVELGLLASAGKAEALCARPPRVRVVVTGDELIGPGDEMRPGAVRDSNAHTVPALAIDCGAEVLSVERAGDDRAATAEALGRALDADLTVLCGGVSVGEHDHVRPALSELGAEQIFWGVALRPGKPTWFGVGPEGSLVFGLPGNPVSAVVTFLLFARPALLAMQGADPASARGTAVLEDGYAKKPGRTHAVRCSLRLAAAGLLARTTGPQGSHVLTSMLGADALAIFEAGGEGAAAGEEVEIELMPGSRIGGWR
ncbi:MAG: gephyrin-like molybdotransferase Glp [Solirubrobacterales bacterium]